MNFNLLKSAKLGACVGFIFCLLNTLGDYMLVGNSIYKDFLTLNFYKKLVFTIVVFSLCNVFFDWLRSLFSNKRGVHKKSL
jgi:hypothetical protein